MFICVCTLMFFFFFSSRRRHTRFKCDWSSDVCSSDLDSVVSLNGDDVVFAGFGIVAPEYHWNDYEGLNVKGKVVMVMVNDPGYGSRSEERRVGKECRSRWSPYH